MRPVCLEDALRFTVIAALTACCAVASTSTARGEPIFLSRGYARCSACHYSPTGGGLLTPAGRVRSGRELSTTAAQHPGREESFLWGALGTSFGRLGLGIDMMPTYQSQAFSGVSGGVSKVGTTLLTADLLAAFRMAGWTVFGDLGREAQPQGVKLEASEYWVGRDTEKGFGVRVGRFLPAYGLRLPDPNALTRAHAGLDANDQVYGVELSRSWERALLQLSLGPGRADSILHDDGRQAGTLTGRLQMDLGRQTVLVLSGIFRGDARDIRRNGGSGLAFGIAPTPRLTIWSEADLQFQQGVSGPSYTLLNETSVEVYRGLWIKVSPQIRTDVGSIQDGVLRMVIEADLLPRTHWNARVSYAWEQNHDLVTRTLVAQLRLYI